MFSVEIVRLVNLLPRTPVGYALGNQLIRSGTSIGANIEEAQDALSRKDFTHSMNISLKEAREAHYWLKILLEAKILAKEHLEGLMKENIELIKILTAIVKNTKSR